MPFSVESALAEDHDRSPGEPSPSVAYSAEKIRSIDPLPEPSSPIRAIAERRRRSGTSKSAAVEGIGPDAKILVSRKAAAEMLSISVRGVDYMIAAKRLSTRRIANRVLIPVDEIRRFARSDHPERMAG
jgi:hypothetical protein